MKNPACLYLVTGALCSLSFLPLAQGRTWTSVQGKSLEAEFVRLDGQKAVLKRSGGQTVSIPLAQLSREDRDFIAARGKGGAASSNPADNYHLPWPRTVKCQDNFKVETIKEEQGEYIYETPHFRFICDAFSSRPPTWRTKRFPSATSPLTTIPPNSPPTCTKSSARTWKTEAVKARQAFSWGRRAAETAAKSWSRLIPWASRPWGARTSLTATRIPPPSSMN